MTWFKIDDTFANHPKVLLLADGPCFAQSVALWTMAGTWSAAQLTDGFVPASALKRLVPFDARKASAELVRVGLWSNRTDGYAFHDWHHYQPTKVEREKEMAGAASRSRKYREKLKDQERAEAENHASVTRDDTVAPNERHAAPTRPDPTRPDHSLPSVESESRAPDPDVAVHVRTFRAYVSAVEARTGRHEAETPEKLKAAKLATEELQRTATNRGVTFDTLLTESVNRWLDDPWGKRVGWKFSEWAKQAAAIAVSETAPRKARANIAPPDSRESHAQAIAAAIAEGRPHGEGWADVGI